MSQVFGHEKKRITTVCTGPLEASKSSSKPFPTLRLNLNLFETTDKIYPEYSYSELYKSNSQNVSNPSNDPFAENDAEELRKMEQKAKHLEAKYKSKQMDLVDLGEGYLEDSFIDNSEAYNEVVPSTLDTKHGGFYINCGKLNFVKNQKPEIKEISEDERLECREAEDANILKKRKLAFVGSSFKKYKKIKLEKEFGKKKLSIINDSDLFSQKKKNKLKKHKSIILDASKTINLCDNKITNKTENISKTQNSLETKEDISKKISKNPEYSKNGCLVKPSFLDSPLINESPAMNLISSIGDNLSQPVKVVKCDSPSIKNLVKDDENGVEESLQPLPANLQSYVDDFKKLIDGTKDLNSLPSQFKLSDEILEKINEIEKRLSCSVSERDLAILFMYLATLVKTTPKVVLKRLRKFRINLTRNKLERPKELLKKAIEEVMPEHLRRYQDDVNQQERLKLEQKEIRRDSPRVDSEEGVDGDDKNEMEKPKRILAPRKKFEWNVTIRSLLNEIVKYKMEFYELAKIRSLTAEEYLKKYLDEEIRPLWPIGWVTPRLLYKESKQAHKNWTEDMTKSKKPSPSNSSPKILDISAKTLIEIHPQNIKTKIEPKLKVLVENISDSRLQDINHQRNLSDASSISSTSKIGSLCKDLLIHDSSRNACATSFNCQNSTPYITAGIDSVTNSNYRIDSNETITAKAKTVVSDALSFGLDNSLLAHKFKLNASTGQAAVSREASMLMNKKDKNYSPSDANIIPKTRTVATESLANLVVSSINLKSEKICLNNELAGNSASYFYSNTGSAQSITTPGSSKTQQNNSINNKIDVRNKVCGDKNSSDIINHSKLATDKDNLAQLSSFLGAGRMYNGGTEQPDTKLIFDESKLMNMRQMHDDILVNNNNVFSKKKKVPTATLR